MTETTQSAATPAGIIAKIVPPPAEHPPREYGRAFAPANIALSKYWGKRISALNVPANSSVSISLGHLGARTHISTLKAGDRDEIILNGTRLAPDSDIALRTASFLEEFRRAGYNYFFRLSSETNLPIGAGLASSAAAFAALVLALDDLFAWNLDRRRASILARLGSGSAARSVYTGFVVWHAGTAPDGMDSYAEPLDSDWPELALGLVIVSSRRKHIGSRSGMEHTRSTSPLYAAWVKQAESDFQTICDALRKKDLTKLGETAEANALMMHAAMLAARPPIIYWSPATLRVIQQVHRLRREEQIPIYFTIDAGPNVKLIFEAQQSAAVKRVFPESEIILPGGEPAP